MNYLHGVDHITDLDGQLRGRRLGLITNPTGVTSGLVPTIEVLRERYDLVRLYASEHGVRGALQAGAKVTNGIDPLSGLPVVSLFGEHEADFAPFEGVDCVLFDIQDIGARFYTYLYTLSDAMKLCAQAKVPLIVLDRYNPLGLSRAEGTLLREEFSSGVGRYELPARHAMTIGEFGRYVNAEKHIGCELQVLPCLGLDRQMDARQVRVPWVMPSPNIPTWESALVYIRGHEPLRGPRHHPPVRADRRALAARGRGDGAHESAGSARRTVPDGLLHAYLLQACGAAVRGGTGACARPGRVRAVSLRPDAAADHPRDARRA